ncbi:MAG: glutathione synthase [Nanoarchaeota archaeon]
MNLQKTPVEWLFVIDPIENLHPDTDTTLAIMEEAKKQGIAVWYCTIRELGFANNTYALAREYRVDEVREIPLDDYHLIFMRKEPPYDLNFHYATQLLSLTKTKVVNNAKALRDFNEKLMILNFPEIIPPTLVSADNAQIKEFLQKHRTGIIKALDSYQGKWVKKVSIDDPDLDQHLGTCTKKGTTQIMIQEFLPAVEKGDKRVLILGGKAIGAVNRMPKEGDYLANFGQGGIGEKTGITEKDQEIIGTLAPFFKKQGILFAGIDIIDGFLTEINITCPTGLVQINNLEEKRLEKDVVEYFKVIDEG